VNEVLEHQGVDAIIPPRKNAKIKQHGNCSTDPLSCDECIRQIRRDRRKRGRHQSANIAAAWPKPQCTASSAILATASRTASRPTNALK
jgi:hypothetical protein